ncbi:hypothetical protein [Cupriavidus oxalaticus]|uniref:Uncharacterized protein n=1 Tax=Cupriavidus oxalaticus TaxID=96344 RepID=A0A375FVI8_9BURK|nr:hypothetical protein [Cupriavidus oxalaticus]WQD84443.1 hypothetical protein U0036_08130 [Cupriavidus oxalaticus]SPC06653.1 conserved exported hypothetical protein [Cupriavidus oxalaticus]SPC12363.1 conserved exported hypothetical protein [Cupriavidus oxalaticus]
MVKKLWLLIVVGIGVLGAGAAYSGTTRDVFTDGSSIMGPRDPYTDGAKAGKFDVYSDGARVGDRRDPFTDGARSGRFDPYTDGTRASVPDLTASTLDNARTGDGTLYGYRV